MPKKSFDVFCPSCTLVVEAKVVAAGYGEYRTDALSPIDEPDAKYRGEHYSVAICPRCSSPFFVRESVNGVSGEFEAVTDETVLFPSPTELSLEGLPPTIASSLEQAHKSFATASHDACGLMCRRALEALCDTFAAGGRGLAGRLASLEAAGHIDTRLLSWADGVRLVGNEAAHDTATNVSAEDARDILEFTEALLMYVFTLDSRFRAFEARRAARGASP